MNEDYTLRDAVFVTLLKNHDLGPSEIAGNLDANYNSVKAALAKLAEDGLLERAGRGNYMPNYSGIILTLMERIEVLEMKELGGISHV